MKHVTGTYLVQQSGEGCDNSTLKGKWCRC